MNTLNEQREHLVKEFKHNDELLYEDYGCDGADECCGLCTGKRMDKYSVEAWLRTALATAQSEAMEECARLCERARGDEFHGVTCVDKAVPCSNKHISAVRAMCGYHPALKEHCATLIRQNKPQV